MTQNKDNEIGLLGAIMRDPSSYETVRDLIKVNDFGWHCYAWAWEAFDKLHQNGLSIDVITVGDELERMGHLDDFALAAGNVLTRGSTALSYIRKEATPRALVT